MWSFPRRGHRMLHDAGEPVTSSLPGTLLVSARHAGFFSNVNCVLNHLRYSLGRGGTAAIAVDWRASADGSQFPYGRPTDGNLWERFFEPLPFTDADAAAVVGRTNNFARQSMSGRRAYAMYKFDRIWRRAYHRLFQRYITVRPALRARADAIHDQEMAGHYSVGVHCRHPDHDTECLHRMPSLARLIASARALLPSDRSWVVVLATDYELAVTAFREAFGERLVVQPGVMRATDAKDEQIHHREGAPSIELGEQALIDALLLARCDALVHVTSNLATAVGYMNPRSRMAYCETELQALSGYLWSLYQYTPLPDLRGRLVRARRARERQATQ